MGLGVIKRFGGYPCAHRQWQDDGHCKYLHGYDRWIEIKWEGARDHRGWIVDFGGLGELKADFERQFDHTCLIAPDDPCLGIFDGLHNKFGAIDMRIMDPTMEGMVEWVCNVASMWTVENFAHAYIVKVDCWENEKNAATWSIDATA